MLSVIVTRHLIFSSGVPPVKSDETLKNAPLAKFFTTGLRMNETFLLIAGLIVVAAVAVS